MNKQRFIVLLTVIILCAIFSAVVIIKNLLSEHLENNGEKKPLERGQIRVEFIDVGKGDCIIIRSGNSTVMIDTGYKETADDVYDHLEASGVTRIDTLILTHYDKDHIGGTKKLLSGYTVGKIYIPDYEKDSKKYQKLIKVIDKNDVNVYTVSDSVTFKADKVAYTVMASGVAYDSEKENDNDMSLLVAVTYGNDSFLFTGDIEEEGINSFLSRADRTYDVIKIPHHGKTEKNTRSLLDSIRPKYAFITDDKDKKADSKLCRLLESNGINYYCTSKCGTVTITGDGSGNYQIETEKK